MTKFFQYILLCVVSLCSLIACDKDDVALIPESSYTPEHSGVEGEVRIVLTDGATRASFEGMTRAILDENNNFYWQSGDKFTLIAKNSAGADAFTPCNFTCWVNTATEGRSYFRGTPDQKMTEGLYSYYAVYPGNGVSLQGNNASFYLPAVQDGTYNDELDFMVARENRAAGTTNNALVACDGNPNSEDPMNDVGFTFYHQFHALRFEIPNTGALSSGIRRVHILFPTAAAGDITVDMASFNSSTKRFNTSYSNTANKITVDFGEGNEKQAGETFWVMVLPQESYSRAVDIRFEDSQGNYTPRQLVTFPSSQQYTAGRLTPIKMNVPSNYVSYTYFDAKTNDTQLGEPVTHLHLGLPEPYYFPDYSNLKIVTEDSNGVHSFAIFSDLIDDTLCNSNISLTYESEHALIPITVPLGGVNVGQHNVYELTTPWLFEQNFDHVTGDYKIEQDQENSAMGELLPDWTGSRYGVDKAVMMHIYQGTSTSSINNRRSRVDSPTFPYLKPNASVTIKVLCEYGGTLAEGTLSNPKIMQSVIEIGATTRTGVINYDVGLDNTYFSEDAGSGGSYSNTPNPATVEIPNFTAQHRISWRGTFRNHSGSGASVITGKHVYVYFDNVRVSIAQ